MIFKDFLPYLEEKQVRDTQNLPVFLVGMPGSGKTTIGKFLADLLEREFYDCDQMIEIKHQCSISEIFAESGEDTFRDFETLILNSLSSQKNAIIATGGGIILREQNRDLLNQYPVVYLDAPMENLFRQTQTDKNHRPLLEGDRQKALVDLMEFRRPLYLEVADVIIETKEKPQTLATHIAKWITDLEAI